MPEPMSPDNLNTPHYWDSVYRKEWEAGQLEAAHYYRDYAPIHEAVLRLIPDGSQVEARAENDRLVFEKRTDL